MTFGDTLFQLGEVSRAHAGHGRRVRLSRAWRRPTPMTRGLTAVAGLAVGHFTDARRPTGCTVVLARGGAVAGVDVRGAVARARARPSCCRRSTRSRRCTRSLLAGGSAFGLDAAGGVMRWLDERGIGFPIGAAGRRRAGADRVPIVPAAILFDLWVGDATIRPDAAAGYAACDAASRDAPAEGNVGAGAGATVGKLFGIERAMKGGIGTASIDGRRHHGRRARRGQRDGRRRRSGARAGSSPARAAPTAAASSARCAALRRGELPARLRRAARRRARRRSRVVATDAVLTKAEANKVAQMAHDGLARSIDPVHTMSDGDIVFALATGASGRRATPTLLGALAADVLADAVLRAVRAATALGGAGLPGLPAARDLAGGP